MKRRSDKGVDSLAASDDDRARTHSIVLGTGIALGLGLLLVVFIVVVPVWRSFDHERPDKPPSCQSNLKQLSTALLMYAEDHSGKLPPASSWSVAITAYIKTPDVFQCPNRKKQRFGYAFNSHLSGARIDDIQSPEKVPLLFETSLDRENATDPAASFQTPYQGIGNVAYADGHVKATRSLPIAEPSQVSPAR